MLGLPSHGRCLKQPSPSQLETLLPWALWGDTRRTDHHQFKPLRTTPRLCVLCTCVLFLCPRRRRKGQQDLPGKLIEHFVVISHKSGSLVHLVGRAQGLVHSTVQRGSSRPRPRSLCLRPPSSPPHASPEGDLCLEIGSPASGFGREAVTPTNRHLSTDVTRPRRGTDGSGLCTFSRAL